MSTAKRKSSKKKGAALVTSFVLLALVAVAGTSYVNSSTQVVRTSNRMLADGQATQLCEAGIQESLRGVWRPFKLSQSFFELDRDLGNASERNVLRAVAGQIPGVGSFSAGIIKYTAVAGTTEARTVTFRSVGWVDRDSDGALDANEPSKTVDVQTRLELSRSKIFDYTYFINNYGWMDGFGETDLVVNGDMRANGNFDFLNGSPTVNGTVVAAANDKIVPSSVGVLNSAPVKMSQGAYSGWQPPTPRQLRGEANNDYRKRVQDFQAMMVERRRTSYSSVRHGADGTDDYEDMRDYVYRSDGAIVKGSPAGATLQDSEGVRAWQRTSVGQSPTVTMLDPEATTELVMPDLSDLSRYINYSRAWTGNQNAFQNGNHNNQSDQVPYVEVYNSQTNRYDRISELGVVNGSAVLVGTEHKPILINGPVTFTQDVAIKGVVKGQGTIYSGRNIYAIGSIKYKDGPDFTGVDATGGHMQNQQKDILGLAARGSILMGNPNTYGSTYPLAYMTPQNPPSKPMGTLGRYDENGNWVPPYNAYERDETGLMRYQSTIPAAVLNATAEGVNQIDAIMYSNFVGGGNVGTSGSGFVLNGTIIARDEAIVTYSLPLTMNYDNRIRAGRRDPRPLIDLNLPRSPTLIRNTWQDRGFHYPR